MKCPVCQSSSHVMETRETASGPRRRRICDQGHKFSTMEVFAKIGRGFLNPDVIVLPAIHSTSKIGIARKALRKEKDAAELGRKTAQGDGGGV